MNRRLRSALRWLWAVVLLVTGASAAARRNLRNQKAVVVLAFHRVLDDSQFRRTDSLSGMVVRRQSFDRLCAYVKRRYEAVDIARVLLEEVSERNRVAITFDDGWVDNHAIVFPIARTYGLPVAAFVCPSLLDRRAPFWPERVAAALKTAMPRLLEREIESAVSHYKRVSPEYRGPAMAAIEEEENAGPDRTVSWPQIEELKAAGWRIGAHTQTHQLLTSICEASAKREIVGSRVSLQRRLHQPCDQFAYPNGNHSPGTRRMLAEAGFAQAFTMERGAWMPDSDPLQIPRINIAEDDLAGPTGRFSAALFEYTAFWKVSRATSTCEGGL